ncbi:MAG: LysR family transcriptional regulator [Parashewanella sp.]
MIGQWEDYRSAFEVAKQGSLSQAAKHLGIAHSTILRHIDRLEQQLTTKLFIRHQRGYQLTEAGRVLLAEMPQIQHQFARMESLIQNTSDELSGQIVITTIPTYAPRLHPTIKKLRQSNPKLKIVMHATDEVIPLDAGSVHVAIRPGRKPTASDVIAKAIKEVNIKLFASKDYIAQHGIPNSIQHIDQHLWVMPTGYKRNIPFVKPLADQLPADNIVYQSNHFSDMANAIMQGIGIGFIETEVANRDPNLVELPWQMDVKSEMLWFVYHRDLRKSRKVDIFYQYIQADLCSAT